MADVKVTADVAGSVWKVRVKTGDRIAEGDELFVLESMKMEIPVTAPQGGVVKSIAVGEGEQIAEDQLLATLDA